MYNETTRNFIHDFDDIFGEEKLLARLRIKDLFSIAVVLAWAKKIIFCLLVGAMVIAWLVGIELPIKAYTCAALFQMGIWWLGVWFYDEARRLDRKYFSDKPWLD